jgi:hypothetical protein
MRSPHPRRHSDRTLRAEGPNDSSANNCRRTATHSVQGPALWSDVNAENRRSIVWSGSSARLPSRVGTPCMSANSASANAACIRRSVPESSERTRSITSAIAGRLMGGIFPFLSRLRTWIRTGASSALSDSTSSRKRKTRGSANRSRSSNAASFDRADVRPLNVSINWPISSMCQARLRGCGRHRRVRGLRRPRTSR